MFPASVTIVILAYAKVAEQHNSFLVPVRCSVLQIGETALFTLLS